MDGRHCCLMINSEWILPVMYVNSTSDERILLSLKAGLTHPRLVPIGPS